MSRLRTFTSGGDTVALSVVSSLLRNVSQVGEDAEGIIERCGFAGLLGARAQAAPIWLSPQQFAPIFQECTLTLEAHACRLDGRPTHPLVNMRMLCYCTIHSRDLREMIERCCDFYTMLRVTPHSVDMALRVISEVACLEMQTHRVLKPLSAAVTDLVGLASQYRLMSWMIGEAIPVIEAHLSYGERLAGEIPAELFPFPLRFGRSCNRICFPAEYLRRPVVRTYADLLVFLDLYPWHPPVHGPASGLSEQVAGLLRSFMTRGEPIPSMAEVAQMLGQSARTFRRRLAAENTSISILKETARRHWAERLLQNPGITLEEIAARLGFSDAATFSRAFKQWTHRTPGDFRRIGNLGLPAAEPRSSLDKATTVS
jgi:AraC-like DNA-binding protein